jgi:hypothetical protein
MEQLMLRIRSLAAAALLALALSSPASAEDEAAFMNRFSGAWVGSGKLLLAADNGLEFACELNGDPSATELTFGMTGRCWMGRLSAAVSARLRYNADTGEYYGQFLDGAEGNGLDIIGSRAGDGFSLKLVRGATQGRLAAEAVAGDQMRVVIYYRDVSSDRELPVVAMSFVRKELLGGSAPLN